MCRIKIVSQETEAMCDHHRIQGRHFSSFSTPLLFLMTNLAQRGRFRKLIATGSLILGIDFSGNVDSAIELIPRRNRLLLMQILSDTLRRKRERAHLLDEKFIPSS
jgi:hypothetical protein